MPLAAVPEDALQQEQQQPGSGAGEGAVTLDQEAKERILMKFWLVPVKSILHIYLCVFDVSRSVTYHDNHVKRLKSLQNFKAFLELF